MTMLYKYIKPDKIYVCNDSVLVKDRVRINTIKFTLGTGLYVGFFVQLSNNHVTPVDAGIDQFLTKYFYIDSYFCLYNFLARY